MKIWSVIFAVFLAFASLHADAAKRLGGGKSVGQQSSNVTQKEAGKAAPQNAGAPAGAAGAAAAAPKRPWGAMLGGLAAGLGLAWLAHSLGMGEAFGQMLMFALVAMAVMVVIGLVMKARKAKQDAANGNANANANGNGSVNSGMALQGAGNTTYNPNNVGNDASARPWERNSMAFDANQGAAGGATGGSMIGSALGGSQAWGVPADFDTAGFVTAAKANFVSLQKAWDHSDIPALRAMMTEVMLSEIKTQLADRDREQGAGAVHSTEVVMLEAQLLGIEDRGIDYMASVEFSGMMREEPTAGPAAFREVWNMTKPKTGGGWLVAGVQALS
jgi:predicted lipid-binding transport protein (Tim44 family)